MAHAPRRKGWELGADDENSPNEDNHANHKVRVDHAHGFVMKVVLQGAGRFHRGDLVRCQFDAGEDEHGADQDSANSAERIEGLRKVEAPLRTNRIA